MENYQIEIIERSLPSLVLNIKTSYGFLRSLESQNVLRSRDLDFIDSLDTNLTKVTKLLDILKTRTSGFHALVNALDESGQKDALQLLKAMGNNEPQVEQPTQPKIGNSNDSEYDHIVVENHPVYNVDTIVKKIGENPTVHKLFDKYQDFARRLETPPMLRQKYSSDLILDKRTKMDVIEDILYEWVSRKAQDAKLSVLFGALEGCGCSKIVESLKQKPEKK